MRRIKESRSYFTAVVAIVAIVAFAITTLIVVWLVTQAPGESRVRMSTEEVQVQHRSP